MTNSSNELAVRRALAVELAKEAGEITLQYFLRPDLEVESKADQSPVTVADRETEAHMRRRIEAAFPKDGIVGEEHGERPGTSGFVWILDPIDGTKSFVAGVPLYATLIGVLEGDECRIGVINAAAAGELVYAAAGEGAWYVRDDDPPRRTQVSHVASLAEAVFLTTEIKSFSDRSAEAADVFMSLQRKARLTRTWGDAYGYLMVITGRADVMIDPVMNLWDAAPLLPLLEEAGGCFVDWEGQPTIRSGEGLATNPRLLPEILQYTRGR